MLMSLWYFKGTGNRGNFGDELNKVILPRYLPEALDSRREPTILSIGTLIASWAPEGEKLVLGSGAWFRSLPEDTTDYNFLFVRGPLTSHYLAIDPKSSITDPGILASVIFPGAEKKKFRLSLMLHHARAGWFPWQWLCRLYRIQYIDPQSPIEEVVKKIKQSERLLAEAMHGAIVADGLRVPWAPVVLHDSIDSMKWMDWCASMRISFRPIISGFLLITNCEGIACKIFARIKAPFALASILHQAKDHTFFSLSRDDFLKEQQRRVIEKFEQARSFLNRAEGQDKYNTSYEIK